MSKSKSLSNILKSGYISDIKHKNYPNKPCSDTSLYGTKKRKKSYAKPRGLQPLDIIQKIVDSPKGEWTYSHLNENEDTANSLSLLITYRIVEIKESRRTVKGRNLIISCTIILKPGVRYGMS